MTVEEMQVGGAAGRAAGGVGGAWLSWGVVAAQARCLVCGKRVTTAGVAPQPCPCCLPPRAVLQSGVYVAGTELEGLHREVRRLLGPTLCAQARAARPCEPVASLGGAR